jgi:uncharacterized protein YceK
VTACEDGLDLDSKPMTICGLPLDADPCGNGNSAQSADSPNCELLDKCLDGFNLEGADEADMNLFGPYEICGYTVDPSGVGCGGPAAPVCDALEKCSEAFSSGGQAITAGTGKLGCQPVPPMDIPFPVILDTVWEAFEWQGCANSEQENVPFRYLSPPEAGVNYEHWTVAEVFARLDESQSGVLNQASGAVKDVNIGWNNQLVQSEKGQTVTAEAVTSGGAVYPAEFSSEIDSTGMCGTSLFASLPFPRVGSAVVTHLIAFSGLDITTSVWKTNVRIIEENVHGSIVFSHTWGVGGSISYGLLGPSGELEASYEFGIDVEVGFGVKMIQSTEHGLMVTYHSTRHDGAGSGVVDAT